MVPAGLVASRVADMVTRTDRYGVGGRFVGVVVIVKVSRSGKFLEGRVVCSLRLFRDSASGIHSSDP